MDLTRNGPQFNVLSDGTTGDFRIPIDDPNDPLVQRGQPVHPVQPLGVRRRAPA